VASQVRRTSAVGAAQGVRAAHERDLQQDKSAAITRASAAATARSHPNNTERGEGADHGTTPGGIGSARRVQICTARTPARMTARAALPDAAANRPVAW